MTPEILQEDKEVRAQRQDPEDSVGFKCLEEKGPYRQK